jgi:hypothetical protein
MKKKNFIIFMIILTTIFISSVIYDTIQAKTTREKIAFFDLQLSGSIIDKRDFFYGHDYGFVYIDLRKSNYEDFDPRNENDDYFFIIKNNKCLLVLSNLSEIRIGDSIVIKINTTSIEKVKSFLKIMIW